MVPSWLEEVTTGYDTDATTKELLRQITTGKVVGEFTYKGGIIWYKDQVWLGSNQTVQHKVMTALHDTVVGGHSVTYRHIKAHFSWPCMKQAVKTFVQTFLTCQQANAKRSRYPSLLMPLPIPNQAWQVVSLDFISSLPNSHHYNCTMVLVDKFSKYAHFLALTHLFSALSVAKLYLKEVYHLHGLLSSIILDRDPIFTSKLWRELFTLVDTKLCMSSAYHPQSDGQTEQVNQ